MTLIYSLLTENSRPEQNGIVNAGPARAPYESLNPSTATLILYFESFTCS